MSKIRLRRSDTVRLVCSSPVFKWSVIAAISALLMRLLGWSQGYYSLPALADVILFLGCAAVFLWALIYAIGGLVARNYDRILPLGIHVAAWFLLWAVDQLYVPTWLDFWANFRGRMEVVRQVEDGTWKSNVGHGWRYCDVIRLPARYRSLSEDGEIALQPHGEGQQASGKTVLFLTHIDFSLIPSAGFSAFVYEPNGITPTFVHEGDCSIASTAACLRIDRGYTFSCKRLDSHWFYVCVPAH